MRKPIPILSVAQIEKVVGPEYLKPLTPDAVALNNYNAASKIVTTTSLPSDASETISALTTRILEKTTDADLQLARKHWASFDGTVGQLRSAAQRGDWQYPTDPDRDEGHQELQRFKAVIFAMQLQAAVSWHARDEATSQDLIQAGLSLAVKIQNSGGYMFAELIGWSCRNRMLRMIRTGLRGQSCTEPFLEALQSIIQEEEDLTMRLSGMFERRLRVDTIPTVRDKFDPNRPYKSGILSTRNAELGKCQHLLLEWACRKHPMPVDREQTLRDFKKCHESILSNLQDVCALVTELKRLVKQLGGDIPNIYKPIFLDWHQGAPPTVLANASTTFNRLTNPYGRIGILQFLDTSAKLVVAAYKGRADIHATQIFLALARLRAHGFQGPLDSLDRLVEAGFLNQIPSDPATGLPFALDLQSQLIWVPGPDRMTFSQAQAAQKSGAWVWKLI